MMATTITWIYADRLKTNPERRHKVKGDSGVLAEKVIMKLDETNEVNIIAGFIYVDKDTGEFTLYNSDQTKWESKDY
jgi:hypothetical protein